MPTQIFKIYDGRTNFWQWDTGQKLIVLDDRVTEVRFSNRDMEHSKSRDVYVNNEGIRVCNVPDVLLQLPKNLIAYACVDADNGSVSTIKAVKFAVMRQPIPADYVCEKDENIEERLSQIDIAIGTLNESKADNICYDEESQCLQLTANGRPIGDAVDYASCGIKEFYVDENDNITITLVDGRVIDLGQVVGASGATFTPHISEDKILTWTCDQDLPVPNPVDLNVFDEWEELGDDGEVTSQYSWEFM